MKTTMTNAVNAASTKGATMDYNSLCEVRDNLKKKIEELNSLILLQENIEALNREYMSKVAELNAHLIDNPFFTTSSQEATEKMADMISTDIYPQIQERVKGSFSIPKPTIKENGSSVESKKKSVFDNPAFKEAYHPQIKAEVKNTPIRETEAPLPTMEELLSDEPEYKKYYHPRTPIKRKKLVTIDELISDEPVNRILNLGNLKAKNKHRQHTRITDSSGICPTLTATGNTTLVYV